MKIKIDSQRCIGCGLCAKVCTAMLFEIKDKACINNGECISCFQCIAVRPTEAVSNEDCYLEDMQEYDQISFNILPKNLLNFMKTRRSIRVYQKREIEAEKIRNIIEAGRFSPTGCNRQLLRFILLDDKLEEFKVLCMR